MDRQWWEVHLDEVNATFTGARYSINTLQARYHVTRLAPGVFNAYGNSGAGCITLAAQGDAKRIILLGYDCQKTNGQAHWHGNHPPKLGNAGQIHKWHLKFEQVAKDLRHINIINASRATALKCFQRMDLETTLEQATT